jgi:hypothetical protein
MSVKQKNLILLDIRIGVFEVRPPVPEGFDFCAL